MPGTSVSAIDTLPNAGLTVRKETTQKKKIQLANLHQQLKLSKIILLTTKYFSCPYGLSWTEKCSFGFLSNNFSEVVVGKFTKKQCFVCGKFLSIPPPLAFLKNFHCCIRHQTNNFNTAQQIINQTKIIDQMRDNYSFTEVFSKIITLFTQKSNNCKIFQNMLNMKFDDDKDKGEDLEDQASLEDNDDNVVVFADEDINRNWRRR
ncbi:hypothetical protein RhiirA1_538527 [Rhizophagus irregularis]|uniref:Uncharacterized protein n=1 Tax=Rhizophagus irregularis TaxID=588596 RepID=A0A2N0RGG5_9GLOM|nr:hypothetical protein RhiirA1_538527 [Rhizophagus irregularis]